jgi:fructose-bisphosphate aldolase class II
MNIDTDLQFAFAEGIRDYMNIDYLKTQIGKQKVLMFQTKNITIQENGCVKAKTFNARLEQAFADLNNVNTL